MNTPLAGLGLDIPVIAAPMAGGVSTPALVIAAARAGGLGFLAAGYKTPQALAAQISEVRSAGVPFAVNVFAPNPVPADPAAYRRYARALRPEAERYGLDLPADEPGEDDDHWAGKVALLIADPVPLVSFTFGFPEPREVAALHRAGSVVALTVTSADEARAATEAGADLLVVQASAAGAHSGTLTPQRIPPPVPLTALIAQVRAETAVPLLAAGGLGDPGDAAAVLRAGAAAAVVGTLLLRADESGASRAHQAALAGPARDTIVTRAFTGRPARGLRNVFTDRYDAVAPAGYPAIHHLTSPLRRAAAAAGDVERLHLWAGTAYRHATAEPAGRILARLASGL
jgi:nitronate monooxygenase